MKKWLKLATVAVALTMFVSAAAEAQGGGGGGGARGGGGAGGGQGRGGRGATGQIVQEGVSVDSAYGLLMSGITLDATKKAAVMKLVTTFQADLKANPQPRGGGGGNRGGAAATGAPPVDTAAMNAARTKRNAIITAFRTEVKKSLDATQATQFDANVPDPAMQGRGRGGGAN